MKFIEVISYHWAVAPVVQKIHKEFDFDLIDLHWTFPDLPTGVKLAEKYQKKLLVTIRGKEAFHIQDADSRKKIVAQNLRHADAIIALSHELKLISEKMIGGISNTYVIRNGVDINKFFYIQQKLSRQILHLEEKGKIILSVGSLIEGKGFDSIIRVLPKILRLTGFENTKIYIIGSAGPAGDYRKALYELVELHRLSDHVRFIGQIRNDDLHLWYNAADVFCLASRGEGSPNVLNEALACGCPSVATDVGSIREIMEEKNLQGICIPAGNNNALKIALIHMLEGKYDRQKISSTFRKYGWDWCARKVYKVYESLL